MRLINKSLLARLKRKNRGNVKLVKAIDRLLYDIEQSNLDSPIDLKHLRPDADCIHSEGFYFFNIDVHRTMILMIIR